jgi:hypothetical protein
MGDHFPNLHHKGGYGIVTPTLKQSSLKTNRKNILVLTYAYGVSNPSAFNCFFKVQFSLMKIENYKKL